MVEKVKIEEVFKFENTIFLDARTPKEFAEDHILGAINVPLLSNEERHEIGIIYKQKSREEAIEKGIELLPAKIPSIHNAVKNQKDKIIVVYCARGGMRSGIVASLIESIGYKVLQLEGGYKFFRHYILNQLNNFNLKPKIICLYGLTCTGKTDLLKKLPNNLDLEGLAQHRGSLLGAVGLKPNSQKKFENLLLKRLKELQPEEYIFVEGEGRRIGDVIIPAFFYKAMGQGIKVFVTRSIDIRVKEAVREYFSSENKIQEIKRIIPHLRDTIGKKKKKEIVSLIDGKKYEEAVKIILEKYYDPLYSHNLSKKSFDYKINSDDLDLAVEELKKIKK